MPAMAVHETGDIIAACVGLPGSYSIVSMPDTDQVDTRDPGILHTYMITEALD